ncbi:AraC family transcriptional regulator [Neobacillus vireti]|uniref:AraC family transcriptional regulator n=1 Tax=Neobacillus vireti TaxID=220686 RepID=UPI002FFED77A
MSFIYNLNLGQNSFLFNYKNISKERIWETFHAHQGLEFLYVHNGNGRLLMDKKIYFIQPGTLIYLQPYQLHKITIDTPYVRTRLVFDPMIATEILKNLPSLSSFFHFIWKENLPIQTFNLLENDLLEGKLKELHFRIINGNPNEYQEEMKIFLISFLRDIKELIQPPTELPVTKRITRHTEKIIEWIENNYQKEFVLERLANHLHLSPYHVSRVFREEMGCTITEYITEKRLNQACFLLKTTSYSISYIRRQVGVSSDSYFSQMFKKHKGMSPNQYRNVNRDFFYN